MENLPPEIIRQILNDLPPSSLKTIRLCWRFLDPFILPNFFHTIKVNFAEKHIKRLQGIALSKHLAPLVQQLIWITSGTRDTHDDPHGHVNTWAGHEDYIKAFSQQFFPCLDAMPSLHTFASELGPPDLDPERDEIDGLVYALWPAMCRPQSKITSFRCQDPLNYMRWLNYECLQAMGGQHTELPPSFPAKALRKTVNILLRNPWEFPRERNDRTIREGRISANSPTVDLGPSYVMGWEWPLKKLLELDLRIDSVGGYWECAYTPSSTFKFFLMEASDIRELSLRFRPTGIYTRPSTHSEFVLTEILACRWKFLQTIKISHSMLPLQPLISFLEAHAETLKHILIRNCVDNKTAVGIIRGAAKVKNLQLHRLLVFPFHQGHLGAKETWIVPERLVLDFVNEKDPSLDPFEECMLDERCNWVTVTQEAAPVSEEWPTDNGMHFTCRQCLGLGQVA
ncbi:hypothetical protein CEP51_013569 [Fusarium floridanum]|uniref:F-box domain-containing protein n=1 Tax=Fusarium floridanum TaxID=1325733 RepID=A0A428Q985_9HYPO|nr:hypothetical protein CEP51_013569 [Fusarium floridanum]